VILSFVLEGDRATNAKGPKDERDTELAKKLEIPLVAAEVTRWMIDPDMTKD